MRHPRLASSLTVLLLAAAPSLAGAAPEPRQPATPAAAARKPKPAPPAIVCKSLSVEGRGGRARRATSARAVKLSATAVEDAAFSLNLSRVPPGDHVVEMRVFMPGGRLYQSLAAPVAIASGSPAARAAAPSHARLQGYPFPVAVQRPETVAADTGTSSVDGSGAAAASGGGLRATVTLTLPVAGTPIVNSSLYGNWTVRAYVDGSPSACATTPFKITQ